MMYISRSSPGEVSRKLIVFVNTVDEVIDSIPFPNVQLKEFMKGSYDLESTTREDEMAIKQEHDLFMRWIKADMNISPSDDSRPCEIYGLRDLPWPVFTKDESNVGNDYTFHPGAVLHYIANPFEFRNIRQGETLSAYRYEYRKWTSTRAADELEKWKDDVWEGVFLRVKENQSSLALQWYTELIALLTRVVSVLL